MFHRRRYSGGGSSSNQSRQCKHIFAFFSVILSVFLQAFLRPNWYQTSAGHAQIKFSIIMVQHLCPACKSIRRRRRRRRRTDI